MKQIIKNYTFNKTARTVTLTDFSSIALERVLLVTNTTTGTVLYQFNNSALGGTAATNVLTLSYDTSAMSNTDKLQIIYDSSNTDPLYDIAPVGGKYNAAAPSLSDGQRSDLQLDAAGNAKVYLATKLDSTNDSVTNYAFGHSYQNINTAATTTIKSGNGILHRIIVNTPVASSSITVYDNTAASGNKIGTIMYPASLLSSGPITVSYECAFIAGLTIVTVGTPDITVIFR